jgi:hypothetical protein
MGCTWSGDNNDDTRPGCGGPLYADPPYRRALIAPGSSTRSIPEAMPGDLASADRGRPGYLEPEWIL